MQTPPRSTKCVSLGSSTSQGSGRDGGPTRRSHGSTISQVWKHGAVASAALSQPHRKSTLTLLWARGRAQPTRPGQTLPPWFDLCRQVRLRAPWPSLLTRRQQNPHHHVGLAVDREGRRWQPARPRPSQRFLLPRATWMETMVTLQRRSDQNAPRQRTLLSSNQQLL